MKTTYIISCFFCVFGLFGSILNAQEATLVESKNLSFLIPLHVPLMYETGDVEIMTVPMRIRNRGLNARAEAFCGPIYPPSDMEADRKTDINLVSAAKIGVTLKLSHEEDVYVIGAEWDLTIDMSRFVHPKDIKLEAYDIIQAMLVCFRVDNPAGASGKINVKIVGAKGSLKFANLEGPLWASGYLRKRN